VLGLVNGWLIGYLELPPIVVTLGTMSVYRGLVFVLSGGAWVSSHQMPADFIAFPLTRDAGCDAPGLDRRADRAGGLVPGPPYPLRPRPVRHRQRPGIGTLCRHPDRRKRLLWTYGLSGAVAGLCGYLWVARYAVAYTEIAYGFEFTVIAACVIGGISIAGGVGSGAGAVLGALFLAVIGNALPVVKVSPFWQSALTGIVILAAVLINARGKHPQPPDPAAASDQTIPTSVNMSAAMNCGCHARCKRLLRHLLALHHPRQAVSGSARRWAAGKACWHCCSWPFVANSILLPNFLDLYNLADGTFNFSEKALIALPMALLIICREIDISVAGILALSSVAMGLAKANGAAAGSVAAVALATGTACGWLNGFLVTRFGLPSIVVTIGTVSLFRGLASVVLGDQAYTGYPQLMADWGQGYFFDMIPREFVVLLVFAALFAVVLHTTTWGRRIYAIGNNQEAARFSGIAVDRYRLALFMLTGCMAGLAAFLLTGRIGSTRPNIAMGWELEVITMVILGGVSIAGGAGTIGGVMLAVLTLGTVTYGLSLANIPGIYMTIVVGILLLVTIALPRLLRGRKGRK
jgi:rhamnose transport system permease protein